ncbi:MAG: hypothetical protein ACYC5Y_05020 [Symbiobacteriia bacterium]
MSDRLSIWDLGVSMGALLEYLGVSMGAPPESRLLQERLKHWDRVSRHIDALEDVARWADALRKRNEPLERVVSLAMLYRDTHDRWLHSRTGAEMRVNQDTMEETRGALFETLSALDKEDAK